MENIAPKLSPPCSTLTTEKPEDYLNKFCRVCFEGEISNNPLTSSCKCEGSVKYIHEECLKKWILSQVQDPRSFKCDICKNPVKMEIKSKLVWSFSQLKYEIIGILLSPLLFMIDSCFVYLSLNFLINSAFDPEMPMSVKVFSVIVLLITVFFDVVLIVLFFESIRNGCCESKIFSWRILSNSENIDLTNLDQVNQDQKRILYKSKGSEIVVSATSYEFMGTENILKTRDRIESASSDSTFLPREEEIIDE